MRKYQKILALLLAAVLLTACGAAPEDAEGSEPAVEGKVTSDSLYVTKVENMPGDFILGMDASCVPALETSGVIYYD